MNFKVLIISASLLVNYASCIYGNDKKPAEKSKKVIVTFILANGMIVDRFNNGGTCLRGSFTLSGGQGFSLTREMTIEQVREELTKFGIKEEIAYVNNSFQEAQEPVREPVHKEIIIAVDQEFAALTTDILACSNHDLQKRLESIQCTAKTTEQERAVLEHLKTKIDLQLKHYTTHSYDREQLKEGFQCLGIGLALSGLTYAIYRTWHKPYNEDFQRICENLKSRFQVVIKEDEQSWMADHTINYFCPSNTSYDQLVDIREMVNQLVDSRKNKKWLESNIEWPMGLIGCTMSAYSPVFFVQGFFTQSKEYTEKYAFLKKRIDNLLKELPA